MRNIIRNEKGFSLIQAVVAGAIGILSVYYITTGLRNTMTFQKGIEQNDEAGSLTTIADLALRDPAACFETFGGKNPTKENELSVDSIKDKNGNPIFKKSRAGEMHKYGSTGLMLTNIHAGGEGVDGKTNLVKWIPQGNHRGLALGILTWRKSKDASGPKEVSRTLMIVADLDENNKIKACATMGQGGGLGEKTIVRNSVWVTPREKADGVTATCPIGKKLTGGGCYPEGGSNHWLLNNYPDLETETWKCSSSNKEGNDKKLLWAYAVCY